MTDLLEAKGTRRGPIAVLLRPDVLVPVGVTILAGAIRLWNLAQPASLVWDEVYYGVDAANPFSADVELRAVHPPVGTKLIGLGVALFGEDAFGRRIMPWLAGTLVVLLTYFLARRLLGSVWWSGLVALFVALDGLQIVNSRTAVLEIFLSLFVLAGTLLFLRHLEASRASPGHLGPWTLACGLVMGLAVSTKWIVAPALAGMIVLTFLDADLTARRSLVRPVLVAFVLTPLAVYVASYTGTWVATDTTPLEWAHRQLDILEFHRDLAAPHAFASRAIGWPLMIRPVPYFTATRPDGQAMEILAVGNPALWWSFVVALPVLLVSWWRERHRPVEVVLAAWLVLYVPWVLVLRNQIFFYYLTPFVPFMALGLVWCLREATRRSRFGRPLTVMVTVAVVVCAVVFLPLWIGLWVSPEHLERLLLFDGWHFR